jgi:AcrR family transcriptional regulator
MPTKAPSTAEASVERQTARDKLLAAANELFYEEGVHSVGIDRVIERAGVAKASLYNTFGSKDELIRAYLASRHEARQRRLLNAIERFDTPRDRLLGVFDAQSEQFAQPGFRGCAFVNASAEATPGAGIEAVCDLSRAWVLTLFADLARDAGAADPDALAEQLVMLYDGASVSAQMDRNYAAARTARLIAQTLLDAAIAR